MFTDSLKWLSANVPESTFFIQKTLKKEFFLLPFFDKV
jgi:hypothetical protein